MDESSEPARSFTLDEAITLAIELQQLGQLVAAEQLYTEILKLVPDHPVALHYSGVLAQQEGRGEEALARVSRSLLLDPGRADWHSNLGNILQGRGRFEEAIAAYEKAIGLDPGHANAHCNLGVLQRALGRGADAEASYRTAISLNPDHIPAYTNLGILLNNQKRTREAVACFCKVITLRPKDPDARRLLALAHCTVGEVDKAVQIYREWLEEEPEDPIARHMLAACSGQGVPSRASNEFVEKIFDNFAASFDSKLAKLSYRAPALVAAMLGESGLPATKSLDVLDAGCGTGLCGPLVAPFARRLTGIDLSGGMLAQAKDKGVYDELVRHELTGYLQGRREAFDLIVSADTLVYFGVLDEALAAATAALRPGGSLIFTLEAAAEDTATKTFRLEAHGRYGHSWEYVQQLLGREGLRSEMKQAELRMEAGAPVAGMVIRATRSSREHDATPPSSRDTNVQARAAGEHDA